MGRHDSEGYEGGFLERHLGGLLSGRCLPGNATHL